MPIANRGPKHDEWIYALDTAATSAPTAFTLARAFLRGWLALCDAMLIGLSRSSTRSLPEHVRVLVSPRSRHFRRPAAALNLLDRVVPGVARVWQNVTLRGARLPVEGGALDVLDHGSGETVYTLETPRGPLVCKVQRASLGRPLPELIALAAHRRRGYQSVVRSYAGIEEVFPRAHFLVVQGPLFGVPAVLSLQEYVGGQKLDLLHDLDDESVSGLLEAHPGLRDQVRLFLARTLEAWERGEWIVDLGRGNLLVADGPGGPRLVYLDVQMKQVGRLRTRRQQVYRPQIERMRLLLQLAESVGCTDASVGTIRSTRNDGSR